MNNNQFYPFERNRYYAGKMLTSADFQAEQVYFNNKRRFLNHLMYGPGVICGCGVFSLDDLSVLVESGAAIDGYGREIVIDSSVVKKLSAIEGFDQLQTNRACLCLRYVEKDVHTVYAIGNQNSDKEYEYNRISENYQLFLEDSCDVNKAYAIQTEFLSRLELFESDDYLVEYVMPAIVSKGKNVKGVIEVTKRTGENKKLSYSGVLQVPAFDLPNGSHEIEIELDNITLSIGQKFTKDYWMKVQDIALIETDVVLKSGSQRVIVDGKEENALSGFSMKVVLGDFSPNEIVTRELGRLNLEMRTMGNEKDYVCIAELALVRTDSAYLIEQVIEDTVKQYISAPSQERERYNYLEFFNKENDITSQVSPSLPRSQNHFDKVNESGLQVATGILEIPLGAAAKKGDICYSGEVIHGLGKGNVYIDIGYEFIAEDSSIGTGSKSTIYGNPDLFVQDKNHTVGAETAVKVMNDKGSFMVAVKLLQNIDYLVLTYRWVAVKFPMGNDIGLMDEYSGKSLVAVTPTAVMGSKENYYFEVKCVNMDKCAIAYELTEPGSGEITPDGVYTAPSKEGVYEIRIYCVDMPVICTYAYAIVKRKGFDQTEE